MVDGKDQAMRPAGETSETGFVSRGRRSEDVEGWHEIVRRFAPYVHAVCVAHGLPEDGAEAVFDGCLHAHVDRDRAAWRTTTRSAPVSQC